MPTAQNGWPVIPDTAAGRRKLADLVLPGGPMRHTVRVLAGDVATIARWHVREYHRRVEPIKPAGCWGWNVRKIGDGPDWSNHSAACAWDLNAPDNPDGVPTSKVMTKAQIDACHALERESDGVLRWGGDYKSDPDAMHWEVVGTRAQVATLAKKIRKEEQKEADKVTEAELIAAVVAALEKARPYKLTRIKDRGWSDISLVHKVDYIFEALVAAGMIAADPDGVVDDSASVQARLARIEAALARLEQAVPPGA